MFDVYVDIYVCVDFMMRLNVLYVYVYIHLCIHMYIYIFAYDNGSTDVIH